MSAKPKDFRNIRAYFMKSVRNKPVLFTKHALDHIYVSQRGASLESDIIKTIRANPKSVVMQRDGTLIARFRKSSGFFEVVVDIDEESVKIVTFMEERV